MNHTTVNENGKNVMGNHNTVNGNDCKVMGNHNTINGNRCEILGNHCTINGSHCRWEGRYNTVNGANCTRIGGDSSGGGGSQSTSTVIRDRDVVGITNLSGGGVRVGGVTFGPNSRINGVPADVYFQNGNQGRSVVPLVNRGNVVINTSRNGTVTQTEHFVDGRRVLTQVSTGGDGMVINNQGASFGLPFDFSAVDELFDSTFNVIGGISAPAPAPPPAAPRQPAATKYVAEWKDEPEACPAGKSECVICAVREAIIIALPCTHMSICNACCVELSKSIVGRKCCICKESVVEYKRVFASAPPAF